MIMCNVLQELNQNSPPLQPDISCHFYTYEERLINWSTVGIKRDALFYQFKTPDDPALCRVTILPDACLNILIPCDQTKRSYISGTFIKPRELALPPNTEYFGFKPYSILGLKAPDMQFIDLVESYDDFKLVFPDCGRLMDTLSAAPTLNERIRAFDRYAKSAMLDHDYTPNFIDYFTVMICSSRGNVLFNNMEQVTGYSERYCREKFKDSHGLSPKQYSSIMRFQNSIKGLLSDRYDDLSSLACDNGYFDQAHFIRDFKKYTNIPPNQFRKRTLNILAGNIQSVASSPSHSKARILH